MQRAHDLLTRWPALDVSARSARLQKSLLLTAGSLGPALASATAAADAAAAGLWRRDPATWSDDHAVQQTIADRLGWLSSPSLMADSLGRLQSFGESIRSAGFTDVVLLGMGGSSLAPEVLRAVLGVAPGWPRLHVLDSTDPAAVRAAATVPERTLYLLASKSGTTIEPNVLAAHFRWRLEDAGVPRWSDHFVAITDDGTELARRAAAERFRDVFINPSDIGGRYSALSFFGLVPAALMGQDVAAIVGWALAMLSVGDLDRTGATAHPAVSLGMAMAVAAGAGRDKLTLLLPSALEPFGLWVEQLVAESTGKSGKGVVPISGEPPGEPAVYGVDRFFVRLRIRGSYAEGIRDGDMQALQAAGTPVAEIELAEPSALGAEFVRWEVATAIAGALLRINPFDEPNVTQAKNATRTLLDRYTTEGQLPLPAADSRIDGITLALSAAARKELTSAGPQALLTLLRPGDYFALLAYLSPAPSPVEGPGQELLNELNGLRVAVRDRTRVATMFGYGPRYLHSTGQLHKGGPNTGVFVIISASPEEDLPIPGKPYSFGTLELAQALGDFASLDAAGRRALHVHLPAPHKDVLRRVAEALLKPLTGRSA